MTDLLAQYQPLCETTQTPPQVYQGFTLTLPDALGPDYTQKIREWKTYQETLAIQRRTEAEESHQKSQLVTKGNETQAEVNVISLIHPGSFQPPEDTSTPAYEIELHPPTRIKHRTPSNIVVILERDMDLPLSVSPAAEQIDKPIPIPDTAVDNPAASAVFSLSQRKKVDSLMSNIIIHQENPETVPPAKPLSSLKVAELRTLCKKHKLTIDGPKNILIRRLQKNKIIE